MNRIKGFSLRNQSASYTLSMDYGNMHRITSKRQHLTPTGVSKWFLPAYGQLVKFAEALGFTLLTFTTDEPKEPNDKEGFHAGLIDKLEQIVTAANPSVTIMRGHCFLASTQMNNARYRPMYLYFQVDGSSSTKIYTGIAGIKCTILMYYHL